MCRKAIFSLLAQLLPAISLAAISPAAAQEAPFRNLAACRDGAFSVEEDFMMTRGEPFDGNPYISDGDLLSTNGQVCARNAELLRRFDVRVDLGLDAVDRLGHRLKPVGQAGVARSGGRHSSTPRCRATRSTSSSTDSTSPASMPASCPSTSTNAVSGSPRKAKAPDPPTRSCGSASRG